MNIHNMIMNIVEQALNGDYQYGKNDCNIVALRIVDLFAGTNWASIAKYKTLKGGMRQLSKLGFDSTQDIIKQHCDEVSIAIDGDIWLDNDNPLIMGIFISGRLLGVNESHNGFELINKPTDGAFYRTRRVSRWENQVGWGSSPQF